LYFTGNWLPGLSVLPVKYLHSLVGTFSRGAMGVIYMLRKHGGMSMLTNEEAERDLKDAPASSNTTT